MKNVLLLWILLAALGVLPASAQYLYRPTPYTYLFNTNATAAEARAYLGLGAGGGSFTNASILNSIIADSSITGGTNTSSLFLNSTLTGFTSSLQTNTDLTASRVLVSDSEQRVTNSAVTATELGYVSGVTSALQTQLNAKGAATNGTFSGGTFSGSTNSAILITGTNNLAGHLTITGTNTAVAPLIVTGSAGMSANLTDWKTNSGGTLAAVLPKGVFSGQGLTLSGLVYPSTDYTISRLSADIYWEGGSGGYFYIRPNGQGNNSGLVRIGAPNILLCTNVSIGAVFNPSYALDISGQARILGTNAIRFGGTPNATDDTVRISQTSANVLALTATSTTVSGTLTPTGRLILPMGEISYFNTTGTLITIGGTSDGSSNMQVVNPATALSSGVHEFDNGGSNAGRLRYTGATTRMFHVAVTLSGTPQTGNDVFVFGVAKGGTVIAASKVLGSTGGTRFSALHAMVELASNEYLELFVGNTSATRNFTVKSLNIFALGN